MEEQVIAYNLRKAIKRIDDNNYLATEDIGVKVMIKKIAMLLLIGSLFSVSISTSAFDFSNDKNFDMFNKGYRESVNSVKLSEITRAQTINDPNDTTVSLEARRNGVTLAELKYAAKKSDVKLEFHKYSDGSTAIICTGKHDVTGHTIVVMLEPKNNLAYVYDTDSYTSEVVNLGEYVQIYQGRTLVPLRKFIEIFGGKVKYYSRGKYDVWWPSLNK